MDKVVQNLTEAAAWFEKQMNASAKQMPYDKPAVLVAQIIAQKNVSWCEAGQIVSQGFDGAFPLS